MLEYRYYGWILRLFRLFDINPDVIFTRFASTVQCTGLVTSIILIWKLRFNSILRFFKSFNHFLANISVILINDLWQLNFPKKEDNTKSHGILQPPDCRSVTLQFSRFNLYHTMSSWAVKTLQMHSPSVCTHWNVIDTWFKFKPVYSI